MTVTVDAHQHFWDTSRTDWHCYWMTDDLTALHGHFGPEELRPLLREKNMERTVLVQVIPSVEETREFLATAAATDFVAGVVGWVDLTDPGVGDTLAALKARPDGHMLVGIRHQAHDEPDPDWLRRKDVQRGIGAVVQAGLTYDILVRSLELPAGLAVVQAFPEYRLVVDHIAKPSIKNHEVEPWASRMKPLAQYPNVWVKLSGMIEEADSPGWRPDDIVPYVHRLLDWFGPKRLMFASNWPVCLLAGSYAQVYEATVNALGDLTADDRASIFGGNAADAYQLDLGSGATT
jgi:L-fuconolactonase